MNVDVDKLIDGFLNKMNDLYNQEVYFIETCYRFPFKRSLKVVSLDDSLRIFFEENNKLDVCGKMLKYCDKDSRRKIKLADISDEVGTDINIVNNYITEDKWETIAW